MAVDWLRDSCTYRAIFKKGWDKGYLENYRGVLGEPRVACERGWLSYLGEEWLGLPSAEVDAKLYAIDDISKLEKLVENLADNRLRILTWDQLFATLEFPSTRRARLR